MRLSISEDEKFSEKAITSELLGTNFVTTYDFEFVNSEENIQALRGLGVKTLRFPGGSVTEQDFTEAAFRTGNWSANSYTNDDGHIKSLISLGDFFSVASELAADVQLVIPTRIAFAQTAGQALAVGNYGSRTELDPGYFERLRDFVEAAMHEAHIKGVRISRFEIGNEFWGSGEMSAGEYGYLAAEISSFLGREFEDIDIIVQVASSANMYSPNSSRTVWLEPDGHGDYSIYIPSEGDLRNGLPEGWVSATMPGFGSARSQTTSIAAAIRDDPFAAETIDGIVDHTYFSGGFAGIDSAKDYALRSIYSIFTRESGIRNPEYHISEWSARNPHFTNQSDNVGNANGLQYAHTTIEAFFELASNGIDGASFWPLTFGNPSIGSRVLIDTSGGDLTFGGVAFQWLSESVEGLVPMFDFEVNDQIDLHGFGNGSRLTIFVAERSGENRFNELGRGVTIDLGLFDVGERYLMLVSRLSSSDGSPDNVKSDPVVTIENGSVQGGDLVIELSSWEILRVELWAVTERDDVIRASDVDDVFEGLSGNDYLEGMGGRDLIDGGAGNDTVLGGGDEDTIWGGGGNDELLGNDGADRIHGGSGWDTIRGGLGDDQILGNSGDDFLFGEEGSDSISLGKGADVAWGGSGDDTFMLSADAVWSEGFFASNVSPSAFSPSEERVSVDGMNRFFDVVFGGAGVDQIKLTNGDDAYFLHDDFSNVISGLDSSSPISRLTDVEVIDAGGGNDLIDLTSRYLPGIEGLEVHGGTGNDTLWGSVAGEMLSGGNGNDIVFGGAGRDSLFGGEGSDVFVFTETSGESVLFDFDPFEDRLVFLNGSDCHFLRSSLSLVGGYIEIDYAAEQDGTVEGQLKISVSNSTKQSVMEVGINRVEIDFALPPEDWFG